MRSSMKAGMQDHETLDLRGGAEGERISQEKHLYALLTMNQYNLVDTGAGKFASFWFAYTSQSTWEVQ